MVSPLNTVPKKGPQGSRHVILDLSFPKGSSVNDHIPKDYYLGEYNKLHLPSVDNLVSLVKKEGTGCMLFERDLKHAYRQIPVDPGDIHVLGYTHKGHIYYDMVLPMGMRSSCQACQRVTNAVAYAFRSSGHDIVNYIDDLAGEVSPSLAPVAFQLLGDLLHDLGLLESKEKACAPATSMEFLGIRFDTDAGTLTIPPDKLLDIKSLLVNWSNKVHASKHEVQSIVGSLNFLAGVYFCLDF